MTDLPYIRNNILYDVLGVRILSQCSRGNDMLAKVYSTPSCRICATFASFMASSFLCTSCAL